MNNTTMQAAQQQSYGLDTEVVRCPIPTVGEHEVLVKVAAAGVDRGTWHLMTGLPYMTRLVTGLFKPRKKTPGRDLAGTVEQIGSQVTDFAVGDEVLGIGSGAFAEYAVARERKLVAKPTNLDMEQAAALATSGLTAWQALHTHGKVRPGQQVLILGALAGSAPSPSRSRARPARRSPECAVRARLNWSHPWVHSTFWTIGKTTLMARSTSSSTAAATRL